MIHKFHFYYGMALSRILQSGIDINLKNYPTKSNSSYILNNKVGIYLKYSTKRMQPRRFSFLKSHQDEIEEMKNKIGEVYIIFICNDDGIACLSYDELKIILDKQHDEIEWVAIYRKKGEMYSVSGSDGEIKYKIGDADFPKKLFSKNKNYFFSIF